MDKLNLKKLTTESRNENTMDIDKVSTLEMVKIINNEDKKVAEAVEVELPKIAEAKPPPNTPMSTSRPIPSAVFINLLFCLLFTETSLPTNALRLLLNS